jgi:membrane protease YdiL (CAAX protease family)
MPRTSSRISGRRWRGHRALALVLWVALTALLVLVAFSASNADSEADSEDLLYEADLAVNGVILYGLLILVSLVLARAYPRPLKAVGFRRFRRRWIWISLGVVVATIVVAAVSEPFLHGGEEQGLAPDSWEPEHAEAFVLNSLVVVLLGPFAEELFFRGLGVRVLMVFGGIASILVTGIAFGLVHGVLGALPPLVLFGVGLAWLRLRSASIWPSYFAHAVYNGLGILLLVLSWVTDASVS